VKVGVLDICTIEVSPFQVRKAEIRPFEVCAAEVCAAEVWISEGLLPPPSVPNFDTFLKELEVIFIRHGFPFPKRTSREAAPEFSPG
jgi:hypothetical protein